MLIDHIIKRICNSRIIEVILKSNGTNLLDYIHQFMESLHVIDSRS